MESPEAKTAHSLDDLIYEEGCARLEFESVPVRAFESGRAEYQESWIPPQRGPPRITPWLDARRDFKRARHLSQDPSPVIGGLRLLVQKWTEEDGILDPDRPVMPFSRGDFDQITEKLSLPCSFPMDFAGGQQIPTEVKIIPTKDGDRIAITCQSPRLKTCMTLVLSHDAGSKITSGFFGYTCHQGDDIISTLKKSAHLALHPLLIPALMHSTWFQLMFNQYKKISERLRSVQESTGAMKEYLSGQASYRAQMGPFRQMTPLELDHIHSTLVQQHAYMSTALSDFVGKMGPSTAEGLEVVKNLNAALYRDFGLPAYIKYWTVRAERELEHREQLLKRVDVQIQVLYFLAQHQDSENNFRIADSSFRISEETKRDSSAMKSLALVSTIFLPTTALATIFSVSSFYSNASDGSGRLVVSTQFWVFWAVAAPITFLVVILWFIWINRKQIREYRDFPLHRFTGKGVEPKRELSSPSRRRTEARFLVERTDQPGREYFSG